MKVKDLKQGMLVEFKEGFLGIMINDITAVTYTDGGYTKSMMGEELATGSYPIKAVYEISKTYALQSGMDFWLRDKGFLNKCTTLWKEDVEPTELTVEEIEKKLGVTNLKIVKGN